MKNLVTYLDQIADSRQAKGIRHKQTTTLVIMIMSIMCGHTGLNAMARFAQSHRRILSEFIPLPRGKTPSSSTIQRLSRALDFKQLCQAFNDWMIQYYTEEDLAIDGKSIKSTVSSCHDYQQNFISLVSFFGQRSNLIWHVGQLENGKGSEINKVQDLIQALEIKRSLFTLDALHCQKKTVKLIIDSGNGYVITVKKNQPKLYHSITNQTYTPPEDANRWKQNGHGHPVSCRLKVWQAEPSMVTQWSGLSRVISVTRKGVRHGQEFNCQTYYITSEALSAYRFSKLIRGHRRIENNLHWVKDVILNEDNCQISEPYQAATLSIIRNIGFNLLIMEGFYSITQAMAEMEGKIAQLWNMVTNPIKKFLSFN